MNDRRPLRIGLLGCGNHSRRQHAAPMAQYVREHPDKVALVGACDLDAARAGAFVEEFGFAAAFTGVDRMLAETTPDAVVCVMPIDRTVALAERLLEGGVTCTIEKPLGASLAEAERLARVAAETRTPHMVSMNRRFAPMLNRAVEWTSGRPVRFIRAGIYRRARAEPAFIWGTALHPVDAMVHLAGPITDHHADLVAGDELVTNWYAVSMQFERGCAGELLIAPTAGRVQETYELFGEDFCAAVCMSGDEACSLKCWQAGELVTDETMAEPDRTWRVNGALEEFAAFVAAVSGEAPFYPTVADAMSASETCFALAQRFGV